MRADCKILALLLLAAVVSYVVCDEPEENEELSGGYGQYYDAYYGRNNVGHGGYGQRYHSGGYSRGYQSGHRGGYAPYGYASYSNRGRGRYSGPVY